MAEVVFERKESVEVHQEGRWRKKEVEHTVITWIPDLRAMSELWRFSDRMGVRLELVFIGELVLDAPELWDLLETSSACPFNDWHAFEHHGQVASVLPYRPDVLGVIDIPSNTAIYGGRGLTIASLR
jgi:hypothetical protein